MATIKDVAEKANLTVTTVSRVLNNRGYISDKTRKKVYQVMEELGYHPNEAARALSKKHSNVIGIIVPSLMHPFFTTSVNYFESYASQKGFKLMVCNSHREKKKEIEYMDMLKSNKVAGIVLCTRTGDAVKNLDGSFPVITFERAVADTIPAVLCDNYQGGVLAANRLLQAGCKRPAVLSGSPLMHLPADMRANAFEETCKNAGVEALVLSTSEQQFETRSYEKEIEEILTAYPDIDGIFATSDVIAAQVIQQCKKKGLEVPKDICLVGFDDVELASLTCPKLTTIHQPVEQMCRYAIDAIIGRLNGDTIPIQTILPVHLVERESVRA